MNRPGIVRFPPGGKLSIVDAITLAGGHAPLGDLIRVWLIQKSPLGEPVKTVVDVDAIIKGRVRGAPILRDGDRVVVIGRDVGDDG